MYKWEYSEDKSAEGGLGGTLFKHITTQKILKANGIKAKTYTMPSCYVGQTLIGISAETKENVEKVLKIIHDYGYAEDLADEIKNIEKIG